mmetsp:Transcript_10178/g.62057  ORF Transcript_10178/g.62057 Transcript_10178/m.62057 type:complete len:183 (-) Transcript_10178:2344-2892(-)
MLRHCPRRKSTAVAGFRTQGQRIRTHPTQLQRHRELWIRHQRTHRPGHQIRSFHWNLRYVAAAHIPATAGFVLDAKRKASEAHGDDDRTGRAEKKKLSNQRVTNAPKRAQRLTSKRRTTSRSPIRAGMDFYVVLERPGYRVSRRRRTQTKVGCQHRVTKEEAMKWFQTKYDGVILNKEVGAM